MANDPSYNEPPKKSNVLLYVLGGIGAVLLLGCCGCGGISYFIYYKAKDAIAQIEKDVEAEPGIEVKAEAMSKAYKDDATAANAQYQNKTVKVTGVVTRIVSPGEIELAGTPGGETVHCQAALSKITSLFSGIAVGDTVTCKGRGNGNLLGNIQVISCVSATKK